MSDLPPRQILLVLALGFAVLIGSLGFLAGRMTALSTFPQGEVSIEPDTRPDVPTVVIDGVENGKVQGRILGGARFLLGGVSIIPNGSGAFRTAAAPLLTNIVRVTVPPGMRFVASVRGKKYYPVTASAVGTLLPENRIYFRTAAEAEGAGYRR